MDMSIDKLYGKCLLYQSILEKQTTDSRGCCQPHLTRNDKYSHAAAAVRFAVLVSASTTMLGVAVP